MASGDISKIAKKAMGITARARITGYSKTTNLTTNQNTNIHIKCSSHSLLSDDLNERVDASIVANFETTEQWTGEFGFDFYSKLSIHVGKYYAKDNKNLVLYREFRENDIFRMNNGLPRHQGDFRLLELEYNLTELKGQIYEGSRMYKVPWLSLMRDRTAKLKMTVVVNEPADSLKFDQNDNFKFTPPEFGAASSGTYEITIECLKEFFTDQKIVLRSYKKNVWTNTVDTNIAGKINVWSNKEVLHHHIVFVRVNIKGNTPLINQNAVEILNKTLNQVCIIPEIHEAVINLQNEKLFEDAFLRDDNGTIKYVRASDSTLAGARQGMDPKSTISEGESRTYIGDVLRKLMAYYYPEYANYLQVYWFGIDSVNPFFDGFYNNMNNTIVINKDHKDRTLAHETFHSLGLQHTFNNAGSMGKRNIRFTYAFYSTDNLMDYNNGIRTFHWQWEAVRQNIHLGQANVAAPPVAPGLPVPTG